jgi:dephospho-CoA kinase
MMGVVVALCGLPGSGKGIFCEKASERAIPIKSMGDIVRQEVSLRGLRETPENVGRIALNLRQLFGEEVIAERILSSILEELEIEPLVIIDGIRSLSEYTYFSERIENISLLAILANREIRCQRIIGRGRGEDGDGDDFEIREQRELEWGMETLIEIADDSIINEGSIEDAHERFDAWLESNVNS